MMMIMIVICGLTADRHFSNPTHSRDTAFAFASLRQRQIYQ